MPIYAGAFLISLLIFVVGVYIGSLIDQSSIGNISADVSSISEKVASVQLLLLTEGNSSSFCPVYNSQLGSIDSEIEDVGYRLSYLEDERNVFDNELKKKYFVLEAESYLLSKKVKTLCGGNESLLINFYSNKNCDRCKDQGTEVLRARDSLEADGLKVKLFSFDGEIGSPVAEAFVQQYNVTGYPSVVIDDNTFAGFRTSAELQKIIKGS